MTINCEGSGEPTIILEQDVYNTGTGWDASSLARFRGIARTCLYSRLSKATGAKFDQPRTITDQVKDVHDLLVQTGVPGPYILVGYGFSGYNLVIYTDQYPKDVAGLVCVDCRYPTFYRYYLDNVGPQTSTDSSGTKMCRTFIQDYLAKKLEEFNWDMNPEYLDQQASEDQVSRVTSVGDKFFMLLKADTWIPTDCGSDSDTAMIAAYRKAQDDYCKLSSKCRTEEVTGVNANTIVPNKAVDKAIQEVYTAVKAGK
jgi:pimeloyl-ACP methyl ester carboxylesterase